MELREVPIESDGMDMDALEKLVKSLYGQVKGRDPARDGDEMHMR